MASWTARCHKCGVKGNNTFPIINKGGSDFAVDGAEPTKDAD